MLIERFDKKFLGKGRLRLISLASKGVRTRDKINKKKCVQS